MKYSLDTNAVIAMMKGDAELLARLKPYKPGDFTVSAIVAHELYFGAYKGHRIAENLARLEALRIPLLEFDLEDARHAGDISAFFKRAGTPIGPYDLLIAGQARARKLILITRTLREFHRVPGLDVEAW